MKRYSDAFEKGLSGLAATQAEDVIWSVSETYFESLGVTTFSYGFLDTTSHGPEDAPLRLYSTMRPDWIERYSGHRYDLDDHIMQEYRRGRRTPIFSGLELERYVPPLDPAAKRVLDEAREAGMRCAVSIPLPAACAPAITVNGICLNSDGRGEAFLSMWDEWAVEILLFVNALHDRMGCRLAQTFVGSPLTDRERECLTWSSRGLRAEAIADRLQLATVTVNVHLRSARSKLGAETLPHAVARAISWRLISP